jgi:hypothetical protein
MATHLPTNQSGICSFTNIIQGGSKLDVERAGGSVEGDRKLHWYVFTNRIANINLQNFNDGN